MSDQAPVLDPKRTALLVMDFQQDVLRRMPGLEPLVARVQGAIADMRDHGGTIGYVRVAFTEEDWAAIPPGNSVFAQAAQNRMMHHEDRPRPSTIRWLRSQATSWCARPGWARCQPPTWTASCATAASTPSSWPGSAPAA
jgi:nicotinamidase-related amidase